VFTRNPFVPTVVFSQLSSNICSLSDSTCWNGGNKWVKINFANDSLISYTLYTFNISICHRLRKIRGGPIESPPKPLNTIVQWWSEGFQRGHHEGTGPELTILPDDTYITIIHVEYIPYIFYIYNSYIYIYYIFCRRIYVEQKYTYVYIFYI